MKTRRAVRWWIRGSVWGFVIAGAGFLTAGTAIEAQQQVQADPQMQAQPQMQAPQGAPAARAVRLSSVEGQVQVSQGNQVLAAQALANTPLFEGSQITTGDDGRAEVQFEDGSVARVSPNSSMTLSVLQQQNGADNTEVVLNSGLGYFEIQGNNATGQMGIRFGNAVVTASGFTVMRVDLDDPPGELAVFSGNAHLDGGNSLALDMHGGESVKLNATDPGNYILAESIEPNSWDAWNSDRDQALTAEEADKTTATANVPNPNNPAWSDLDANGNWYNVPGQGNVWSPYEAENSNWDPYGCGSWMWEPGYGYTWVSCEPWGYLPYAGGMWSYYDGFGWGWTPGFGGPWWYGGGGWGYNVGYTPFPYTPPHRPRGRPIPPGAIRPGGRYQPFPVVAVNRMHDGGAVTPIRPHNGPVMVAGNTVAPLRPISPRPVYDHSFSSGFVNRGAVSYPSGARYGFAQTPGAGSRPGSWNTMPSRPSGYYGNYASHPSAPSHSSFSGGASHPSSGGGGGAPRAGGGGGMGGGGGAAHGGGGGGGGGGGHH